MSDPATVEHLVAKHETYWTALAQANPHSRALHGFMRAGWDPFWIRYMEAVTHGLTAADVGPITADVMRLRANAQALSIPVPDLADGGTSEPPQVSGREYDGRRMTDADGVARLADDYRIGPASDNGLRVYPLEAAI